MANTLEFVIVGKDGFKGVFASLTKGVKIASVAMAGMGAALIANAKATATAQDEIGKYALRIGETAENLSTYQTIADFSGISNETLRTSFEKLSLNVAEAADGTAAQSDALKALGIEISDIQGKKPSEQFEMFAKAMDNVEDSGERVRLSMDLMGRSGTAMLQAINNGSDGLQAMKDEAERFGVVVSTQAAANAAEFNDSLTRMQLAFRGLRQEAAEKTIPILTGVMNRLAGIIADNRDTIIDWSEKMLKAFAWVAEKGAYAVGILVDAFRGIKMVNFDR